MARDLAFLKGPLVASASPGLESVDPRLSALTALAERGQYSAAANQVEELVREGVYDIRPLSFLFYAVFFESGFAGLVDVFAALQSVLGQNLEAIGPSKRRQEHFDKRLAWLFETIADAIEYHERRSTTEWLRWRDGVEVDTMDQATAAAKALAEPLAVSAYGNAAQRLGRLASMLRKYAEALPMKPEPPVHAAPTSALVADSKTPATPPVRALDDLSRARIEIEVSHHFLELCQKLRAFETLVEKGQFERASLVCDDLLQTVDHFDPRTHFPELFSRFSALMSKNIGVISKHWGDRDSVAWKALTQYYRVDLKGFVEG